MNKNNFLKTTNFQIKKIYLLLERGFKQYREKKRK